MASITPSRDIVFDNLDRNLSFQIQNQVSDLEGRFLGADILLNQTTFSECSSYAPTQDKPKEQIRLLGEVEKYMEELCLDTCSTAWNSPLRRGLSTEQKGGGRGVITLVPKKT